jgi:hypothetical protein
MRWATLLLVLATCGTGPTETCEQCVDEVDNDGDGDIDADDNDCYRFGPNPAAQDCDGRVDGIDNGNGGDDGGNTGACVDDDCTSSPCVRVQQSDGGSYWRSCPDEDCPCANN